MSGLRGCRSAGALPRLEDVSPHFEGATLLSWHSTPCGRNMRCQPSNAAPQKDLRPPAKPNVVSIDEFQRPFSPYVIDEHIEVSERDLQRCGNDLSLLRQCNKKGRACPAPRPTPSASASPNLHKSLDMAEVCDGVASQLQKMRSTSQPDPKGPLPRVLGRWSMMEMIEKSSWPNRQKELMRKPEPRRQLGAVGHLALNSSKDSGSMTASTASGLSSARSTATSGMSNVSQTYMSRGFDGARLTRSLADAGRTSSLPTLAVS